MLINTNYPLYNNSALVEDIRLRLKLISKSLKALNYSKAFALSWKATLLGIVLLTIPIGFLSNSAPSYQTQLALNSSEPLALLTTGKTQLVVGDSDYDKAQKAAQEAAAAAALAQQQEVKKTAPAQSLVAYNDPSDFTAIYKTAASQFGISDWRLLKAVHYVETGCSGSTSKSSYAGARGPMQFLPSTWRAYGVDGNGDGVSDINNVYDAIFGAANYLAHGGAAEGNIDAALLCYNHSWSYVAKVKEVMYSIN